MASLTFDSWEFTCILIVKGKYQYWIIKYVIVRLCTNGFDKTHRAHTTDTSVVSNYKSMLIPQIIRPRPHLEIQLLLGDFSKKIPNQI